MVWTWIELMKNGQYGPFVSALTMLKCPLLHVGLLFCWETQKTEDAVLEGGHFEVCSKLLLSCMEEA